jgi:hypothetical protein
VGAGRKGRLGHLDGQLKVYSIPVTRGLWQTDPLVRFRTNAATGGLPSSSGDRRKRAIAARSTYAIAALRSSRTRTALLRGERSVVVACAARFVGGTRCGTGSPTAAPIAHGPRWCSAAPIRTVKISRHMAQPASQCAIAGVPALPPSWQTWANALLARRSIASRTNAATNPATAVGPRRLSKPITAAGDMDGGTAQAGPDRAIPWASI